MHPKNLRYFLPLGALAATLLLSTAGCNKQAAPAPQAAQPAATQPAPVNDNQITAQILRQIVSEPALDAGTIQVQSVNGVVTLNGGVRDDAARELAAADSAQIAGVRTVVNNLVVMPAPAAPQPASAPRHKSHPAPPVQQQADNTPPPPPPVTPPVEQDQPAPPPPPPPQPVAESLVLPMGSDIPVRISETLDSGVTKSDTPFHGAVASNLMVDGVVAIPRGASIVGRVIEAKDAAHFKGRAELSLELTQMTTQGNQISLVTQPLLQLGAARGKDTTEKAVGGALLGTLIGALAGGGKGALIGAAGGAGAGIGANAITHGQQVKIPSESVLHFVLTAPVQVTVMVPSGN